MRTRTIAQLLIAFVVVLIISSCQYQDEHHSVSQDRLDEVQVTALQGTVLETYCAKWRTVLWILGTVIICWGLGKIPSIDIDIEIIEGHKRTIPLHVGHGIAGFISGIVIWLLHLDSEMVGKLVLSEGVENFFVIFPLVNAALWLVPVIGNITRFAEYSTSIILAIIITLTPFDGTRKERDLRRAQKSSATIEHTITTVEEDEPIINFKKMQSLIEEKFEGVSKEKVLSWGKEKYESASSFVEEKSQSVSESLKEKKAQKESKEDTSSEEKPNIFKRLWVWIKDKIPHKEE